MPGEYCTYYRSPLGLMRIGGTDTCISEVSFIDDEHNLAPASDHIPPLLLACTEQLIQYFNGERRVFDLPLNQAGTLFQQQVWSMLLQIEFGRTISYMALARQFGDPKAIRAVANANGKNDIAIIVPCHRVIGSNQTLVGYAGGLHRKRFLLQLEDRVANGVRTLF